MWKLSSTPWCLKSHEAELDTPAVAGHPARADHHGRNILGASTPRACSCALAPRVRRGSRSHRAGRDRRCITGALGRRGLAHATGPRQHFSGWSTTLHCAAIFRTEAHVTYQRKPYLNGPMCCSERRPRSSSSARTYHFYGNENRGTDDEIHHQSKILPEEAMARHPWKVWRE
jgi:hypothetical protein